MDTSTKTTNIARHKIGHDRGNYNCTAAPLPKAKSGLVVGAQFGLFSVALLSTTAHQQHDRHRGFL